MVSLNSTYYNASATAALRALQNTSSEIDTAQQRISTGFKVNSSSDNASLWTLATRIRSDVSQTQTIQDGIKTAIGKTKVASGTLDSVGDILQQIKAKVVASKSVTDKTSIQADILSLQNQLKSVIAQGTFSGDNWLDGSIATITVATGASGSSVFTDSLDLSTTVLTTTAGTTGILEKAGTKLTATAGKSILTMDVTQFDDATTGKKYSDAITDIETAIKSVSDASATMASFSKRLDMQSNFLTTLNDVKTTALGTLINADLSEESAKVTALQTSQSLATSMLAIANNSRTNILRLFQ